jgi:hypothetical protein
MTASCQLDRRCFASPEVRQRDDLNRDSHCDYCRCPLPLLEKVLAARGTHWTFTNIALSFRPGVDVGDRLLSANEIYLN